jgi:competence protein ComEA
VVPSIAVSRPTALAAVAVLLLVLVVAGPRLARTGAASPPQVAAPLEVTEQPRAMPVLVVHVVGAVRRPGLFRLRDGARVADAVARAGGETRMADLSALNLAAPLVDGIQVLVPRRVPGGAPAFADTAGEAAGGLGGRRVSLATATVEDLDELPGVGPVTAQQIVDYRAAHGPFGSVDDLDAVPGIGPSRIEQLRDLVTP